MIYFGKFSLKIWPLFGLFPHFRIWPFLNKLMAKFDSLFLGGDLATLVEKPAIYLNILYAVDASVCEREREREAETVNM